VTASARIPVDTRVGDRILRFDRTERTLHWVNAVLVLICMITGAILYVGPLSAVVGRRNLVKDVHVLTGLALPVPFVVALAGRWRSGVRADAARLGRWIHDDTVWLRSRGAATDVALGKFNGGQKLNATFLAGILPVLLLTGLIMRWFDPFPDSWRTGATFVHDLASFGVWIAVAGHIAKSSTEPEMLRSMINGWVPAGWAERHRPRWHAETRPGPPYTRPPVAHGRADPTTPEEPDEWTSASVSPTPPRSSRSSSPTTPTRPG
jgi:formate dehydrogenase subunit gamma